MVGIAEIAVDGGLEVDDGSEGAALRRRLGRVASPFELERCRVLYKLIQVAGAA